MGSRLEHDIQTEVSDFATSINLIRVRLNVTGRKGWPDYLYGYKGRVCFVEFKRPGCKPEPIQDHVHTMLRAAGFWVFVVDNADYGMSLLKEWKYAIDREQESLDQLRQKPGRNR